MPPGLAVAREFDAMVTLLSCNDRTPHRFGFPIQMSFTNWQVLSHLDPTRQSRPRALANVTTTNAATLILYTRPIERHCWVPRLRTASVTERSRTEEHQRPTDGR